MKVSLGEDGSKLRCGEVRFRSSGNTRFWIESFRLSSPSAWIKAEWAKSKSPKQGFFLELISSGPRDLLPSPELLVILFFSPWARVLKAGPRPSSASQMG